MLGRYWKIYHHSLHVQLALLAAKETLALHGRGFTLRPYRSGLIVNDTTRPIRQLVTRLLSVASRFPFITCLSLPIL